ncbi:hypothetical protein [Actinoplanes xinjiangensis]|uniref:Uncharacterized protein n=1 Tax=Actinoplanes xinjiangensis TaxID=512350 RepID=A0A316FDH6_9ACTN|nr:hypothetical protein [Actinoplanes xinjiangensis]PWK46931.1 hypothetical protein BC793_10845 [Actinoplanes xinjiangensis]GIF40089.1 hypothetical protein Axi01nite_44000 [Actinoplanes xinjiangensis]
MILFVVMMALLGGTTWLAMNQSIARDAVLNHRLTAIGLTLCLASGLIAVVASAVASR